MSHDAAGICVYPAALWTDLLDSQIGELPGQSDADYFSTCSVTTEECCIVPLVAAIVME